MGEEPEVGDAPPGRDPWDSMTSTQRYAHSKAEFDGAMQALGHATTQGALATAETNAAMALTTMRSELARTDSGRAEYARRREALIVALSGQEATLAAEQTPDGVDR